MTKFYRLYADSKNGKVIFNKLTHDFEVIRKLWNDLMEDGLHVLNQIVVYEYNGNLSDLETEITILHSWKSTGFKI